MKLQIGRKLSLFISICVLSLLGGCDFSDQEMIGIYTPLDYTNTFDTIQIQPQGKYYRRIFDKSGKLVLEMNGKWKIRNDVIEFQSPYFFNLDRDLSKFPELLEDTLSNGGGWIDRRNGTITICVGDCQNKNCYQKLK